MQTFSATILRFGEMGDKTGWWYIIVPAGIAGALKPGVRRSFRVKGWLDRHPIKSVSLLPMGDGEFMIPMNADIRKGTGKKTGEAVAVRLEADDDPFQFNADFMECLAGEPEALTYFEGLKPSMQRYYSKWIDSAKTDATTAKRIGCCIKALARRMDYGAMLREEKEMRKR